MSVQDASPALCGGPPTGLSKTRVVACHSLWPLATLMIHSANWHTCVPSLQMFLRHGRKLFCHLFSIRQTGRLLRFQLSAVHQQQLSRRSNTCWYHALGGGTSLMVALCQSPSYLSKQ